jgi:hypothetical protein
VKPLTKYTILTVSLLVALLPKRTAQACGFSVLPGEYRFWLLQPDLTNKDELTPFFFASTYLYKGNMNAGQLSYVDENIEEWYKETGGKASKKDIGELLYEIRATQYFSDPSAYNNNQLLVYLLKPAHKELFRYFLLSKKVEEIAAAPDPWGEEMAPRKEITAIINEGQLLYRKTKSPFIKLRSAFQLTRLYGFNDEKDLLDKTYAESIQKIKTTGWIKTAALFQKAIHTHGIERDSLLSRVFDRGNYNVSSCIVQSNHENIQKLIEHTRNKHQKAVLHTMVVLQWPGRALDQLKAIYHYEPAYPELPFLCLREVNKIEDWLITNKVTDFKEPAVYGSWSENEYLENASLNHRKDVSYAREVYKFLLEVINERKQNNNGLISLYAAHLSMMLGDTEAASLHLESARKAKHITATVQTQIRINSYLLHLENGFNRSTEKEFMSIIKTPVKKLNIYDPEIMKDQLVLYTAKKMIRQGNRARGIMLLSRTRRAYGKLMIWGYKNAYQEMEEQATKADYDEMLRIIDAKNPTKFEQFLAKARFSSPNENFEGHETYKEDAVYWNRNKVLDGKSGWYIRNHDLRSALQVLKLIPDSFWKKEPYVTYSGGDHFFLNYYYGHASFPEENKNYNKRQAIKEMIRLEELAVNDKSKAAQCYFKLANAWYNLSYYGKNWLMVKQWWSVHELEYYYKGFRRTPFNDDYYGCNKAKEYYLKALQLTKDKELAAVSCFMAGACMHNFDQYIRALKDPDYHIISFNSKANPFLPGLKKKPGAAGYYQQVINECETYKSFIRKYSRIDL